MSAGTLTLTNNSAAVTGSDTAFTTELSAGDFFVVTVGGIPYTLPVKTVNSATSLTLVSNYTGPTQAGAAWYAVPRAAMNLVTAAMVAQNTEALRGLNYDKQNWQQFFTAEGDVTITLPDNSQTTGPSAKKLINSAITLADVRSLIDAICPVGMLIHWPSEVLPDNTSLGIKYLRLNGASFSKTLYPELGEIYTSGVLPDMRGDVVRGYDDGRGIDQGRSLLSEQLDAVPNVTGAYGANWDKRAALTGPFFLAANGVAIALNDATSANQERGAGFGFDLSRANAVYGRNGSSEVRMRNMAWNMIVRAS